jgi:hypothetical protein
LRGGILTTDGNQHCRKQPGSCKGKIFHSRVASFLMSVIYQCRVRERSGVGTSRHEGGMSLYGLLRA